MIWGQQKALGIDGFRTLFFQKYWYIIGKESSLYYLDVLNNDASLESMNVTNIVLIPKIPNPNSMDNFCPISLCTVIYKVIAKMVPNRFRKVLDVCIDSSQSAFVPGKLISDNMLIAYELLHTFG